MKSHNASCVFSNVARYGLLIFLWAASLKSLSQNRSLDSLSLVLKNYPAENIEKADLFNEVGYRYWIINPDQSIINGKQALLLSKKLDYLKGTARANRVIGVAYWSQGFQNKALEYLNESYQLYEQIEDKEGLANTTLNIGMVYADLKENEKAISYFEKAIYGFTVLELKSRIATTYTKLGTVLLQQGNYDDAHQYFINALEIHTANGFTYGIAEVHNRLALLYLKTNEKEQAFFHVKKAITLGEKVNDAHGLANNTIIYGKILRLLDRSDEAITAIQEGLVLAKNNNLKQYELEAYDQLKELKKERGALGEALMFYDKYTQLKDSLINSERLKQIAYLEFENQLEKKDKELLTLNAKEENNRLIKNVLILLIVIIILSGGIIFFVSRSRARKSKELALKAQDHLASLNDLTQKDLENSELKREQLKRKLDYKNKELTSYTLNFIQKNEIITQLESTIKEVKKTPEVDKSKLVNDLKKIIRKNLSIDKDWENFNRFFEDMHQGFDEILKRNHPDLTNNDLKLCALIRLNLNIKETAGILNISPESVKTARYRLRKKLQLDTGEDVYMYLSALK